MTNMANLLLVWVVLIGSINCQDTIVLYEPQPNFLNPLGAPYRLLDAAFYRSDTRSYYLFHGSEYIVADIEGNMQQGWPKRTADEFGIPASWDSIDAAYYDELQEEIWFFRGSQCLGFKQNNLKAKNSPKTIQGVFAVPSDWRYVDSVFYTRNEKAIFLIHAGSITKVPSGNKLSVWAAYPKNIKDSLSYPQGEWGSPDLLFSVDKGVRACKDNSCVFIDTKCDSCMRTNVDNNPISLLAISWGIPLRWTQKKIGYLQVNLLQSLTQTHDPDNSDDVHFNFQNSRGDKLGCRAQMTSGNTQLFRSVYFPCEDTVTVTLKVGDSDRQSQTISCLASAHYTVFKVEQNTNAVDLIGDIGDSVTNSLASAEAKIASQITTSLLKLAASKSQGRDATYGIKMFVGVDQMSNQVSSQSEYCSEAFFSQGFIFASPIFICLLSFILFISY